VSRVEGSIENRIPVVIEEKSKEAISDKTSRLGSIRVQIGGFSK